MLNGKACLAGKLYMAEDERREIGCEIQDTGRTTAAY